MLFLVTPPLPPLKGRELEEHLRKYIKSMSSSILPITRNSLRSYYLSHPTPTLPSRGGSMENTGADLLKRKSGVTPYLKGVRLAADGLSRRLNGDVITPYPPPPAPDGEGVSITKGMSAA